MMKVTLVVPDPPPMRTHPGRSADRVSPNAEPLALAGEALVASDPASFPIRWDRMTVVYGWTAPDEELGYSPYHPIIEVLADVGAVVDPEGYAVVESRDAACGYYVVSFELETGEVASGR